MARLRVGLKLSHKEVLFCLGVWATGSMSFKALSALRGPRPLHTASAVSEPTKPLTAADVAAEIARHGRNNDLRPGGSAPPPLPSASASTPGTSPLLPCLLAGSWMIHREGAGSVPQVATGAKRCCQGASAKLRAFPSSFALLAKKRRGFSFGSILPFLDSEPTTRSVMMAHEDSRDSTQTCALYVRRGA